MLALLLRPLLLTGCVLGLVAHSARAQHALRFTSAESDKVAVLLAAPAGSFTLAAWVKYTGATYTGSHNTIIEFANDDPYFGILGTGALELYRQHDTTPLTVSTQVWHHVACTYNRATSTTALYLDGVPVATSSAAVLSVPAALTMGIGYNSGDWGWQGEIDEVMVWSVVRTPVQILADRRGYAAAQVGMLAYFKFDEGAGQTVGNLVPGGPGGVLGTTTAIEPEDPQWTSSNILTAPPDLPTTALALTVAPNPSAGATTLTYALPTAQDVTLRVHDATGRRVATLVAARQLAGTHTVAFNAAGLPAGLYTCVLSTPTAQRVSRLVLTQ